MIPLHFRFAGKKCSSVSLLHHMRYYMRFSFSPGHMVKKSLAIDPYSFEPTTSSVFTWDFVLDLLEVLLFAFEIL